MLKDLIKQVKEFNDSSENYVLLIHITANNYSCLLCKKEDDLGVSLDRVYHSISNSLIQSALVTHSTHDYALFLLVVKEIIEVY